MRLFMRIFFILVFIGASWIAPTMPLAVEKNAAQINHIMPVASAHDHSAGLHPDHQMPVREEHVAEADSCLTSCLSHWPTALLFGDTTPRLVVTTQIKAAKPTSSLISRNLPPPVEPPIMLSV